MKQFQQLPLVHVPLAGPHLLLIMHCGNVPGLRCEAEHPSVAFMLTPNQQPVALAESALALTSLLVSLSTGSSMSLILVLPIPNYALMGPASNVVQG